MGIFEKGFEKPSPIQEEAVPILLQGRNVIARAKNGTGKTAAFCIPMLQKVNAASRESQGLVLVPSRELSMQTTAVLKELGKHLPGLAVVSLTGGSADGTRGDIARVKAGAHIIVATPGKLRDLADRGVVNLRSVTMVALDEADKLIADSMQTDCEDLLARHINPDAARRQICLFSATFPAAVKPFVDRWMKAYGDPYHINLMDELTLKGLTQFYAFVDEKQKLSCLDTLFRKLEINQSMIFCNSATRVELLAKRITEMGSSCFYIHSRMEQADRNRVFHEFRAQKARHLVASDLVTRGIDVPTVNVVINFDFPKNAETYLHRIGRAGRFGHLGLAVNFVTIADKDEMYKIEQELSTEITPVPPTISRDLYCV